jgi:hypothetical protein
MNANGNPDNLRQIPQKLDVPGQAGQIELQPEAHVFPANTQKSEYCGAHSE